MLVGSFVWNFDSRIIHNTEDDILGGGWILWFRLPHHGVHLVLLYCGAERANTDHLLPLHIDDGSIRLLVYRSRWHYDAL